MLSNQQEFLVLMRLFRKIEKQEPTAMEIRNKCRQNGCIFLMSAKKNHTYHPTVPVCLWESRGDHEDNSNNCNASCNPTWQLETYFIFKTADICLDQFSLVTCHTSLNKAFCWCPSKNLSTIPWDSQALAPRVVQGHHLELVWTRFCWFLCFLSMLPCHAVTKMA